MRKLRFALIAALLLKCLLALFTVGTNDSLTWDADVETLKTAGFVHLYEHGVRYRATDGTLPPVQEFIHPPPMVHVLFLLGTLRDATGMPPHVWLRMACALADLGTALALWFFLGERLGGTRLLLFALSPVSALVSGFHGNTDPIMMFFVVLAVCLAGRGKSAWAGAAFGAALCVKIVPVIFAPAIFFALPEAKGRLKWVAAAAAVWLGASMPWIGAAPRLIFSTMFAYSGAKGLWGFGFLTGLLKVSGFPAAWRIYSATAKWLALAAAGVPLLLRRGPRPSLLAQCGIVAFLFLFLSPGFGLQYLCWTAPWVLILKPRRIAAYYAAAGAFMLSVYVEAAWSNGPQVLADLLSVKNWTLLILLGIVCWTSMAFMARFCFTEAVPRRSAPSGRDAVEISGLIDTALA